MLMEPTACLIVPSLHDGISLECRVYHPPYHPDSHSAALGTHGAIVAHPYAPLGGSYDDPIVKTVVSQLRKSGFVVGTFNFRGAGRTQGKTSWTGNAELIDYASFAGYFVLHLYQLQRQASATKESVGDSSTMPITLIYGGYSYGAMVASRMNLSQDILAHTNSGAFWSGLQAIKLTSGLPLQFHVRPELGADQFNAVSARYLLISPLVGPVKSLITFFSKEPRNEEEQDRLTMVPTLAAFGTNDTFIFLNGLRTWAERLSKVPGSHFRFVEVVGAGHFWHEPAALPTMQQAIDEWLRDGVTTLKSS